MGPPKAIFRGVHIVGRVLSGHRVVWDLWALEFGLRAWGLGLL